MSAFCMPMNDQEASRFYKSAVWKQKRQEILIRDHFECQDCRKRIEEAAITGEQLHGWQRSIHRAQQVHHIQPLKERPDLALRDDNLVSLCIMCHNLRHGREPFQARKKKLREELQEKW